MNYDTALAVFRRALGLRLAQSVSLVSSDHAGTFSVFVTRACMDQRELRPLLALADEYGLELTWMGDGAKLWWNPYLARGEA